MEAVHNAASAEAAGDKVRTQSEAARALALVKSGLESYAGVARDRSDKGAIAVMNEYVYRPLRAKLVDLKKGTTTVNQPAVPRNRVQVDQSLSV